MAVTTFKHFNSGEATLKTALKSFKSKGLVLSLGALAFAAWALTYGPFYIAAAGPTYRYYTFADDDVVNYQGAIKLSQIYLAPVLNTEAKIKKAIESDYMRVVYYDGQIYDYKIERWPSSLPLGHPAKMATSSQAHLSPSYQQALRDCNMGRSSHMVVTLNTGYWGVQETSYPDHDQLSSSWVSTGTRTYDFDDCGGK